MQEMSALSFYTAYWTVEFKATSPLSCSSQHNVKHQSAKVPIILSKFIISAPTQLRLVGESFDVIWRFIKISHSLH